MKKLKLLLAFAIAFAALSFTSNAKAQGPCMVTLTYVDGHNNSAMLSWDVMLHNIDTGEDFDFYSDTFHMLSSNQFDLGDVPPGNYSVAFAFHDAYYYSSYFDYTVVSEGTLYKDVSNRYMSNDFSEVISNNMTLDHSGLDIFVTRP